MRRFSLRTRLLAGVGLVAVVLAIVAIVITSVTRSQLIDQVDDRLTAAASDGGPTPGDGRPGPGDPDEPGAGPPERRSDFYEGILADDGTLVTIFIPNIGDGEFAPPELDPARIDLDRRERSIFTAPAADGAVDYRVLITAGDGDAFVTALPLDSVASTIDRLVTIIVVGLAIVLVVLAIVTWWMLRLGIRPIRQMTSTASAIAAGDLRARADESSSATESHELAVSLNTMMDTIENAIDERTASEDRLRRFVADASHELRTPVTTIRGYAELHRIGGLTEPGQLDDAMRRTEAEAARMARLIDDMLTLAKLDEQRPLAHAPVDIADLARDVASDARAAAPQRTVTVTVDEPLPVIVDGDADRLHQVLANVVANAVVHTDPDVPVTISVRHVDDRVVVEVRDEGPGMPADVVERVTERFYRADPARSRRRGGSGLGMAIVDAAVAAHGGTVRIDSTEGRGTTVTVELPAART